VEVRLIFLFDWQNYAKLLRLAARESNLQVRIYFLVILLLWVPPVSLFHALCFFLDGLVFPGLSRVEIKNPVFIVGHARSGTTLVHRLMSQDEERFSAFMLYEMYFPSLLQKWVIRRVGELDRKLGGYLGRRIVAWDERHYAATQSRHPMSLTKMEEDDMVLYYSMASGYWITKLPYLGSLDFYYVDEWPEKKRRRMMRFYRECLRRQLYLNGPEKTHLNKSPIFAGRVETLIETFPDARIVVPVRNPFETIPSLLKLMRHGWKALGWGEARQRPALEVLANQSFHTYRHPLEVLARMPHVPHAVIEYRDLLAKPAETIEKIYRDLDFEITPHFRKTLQGEVRRAREHKSGNEYSLEEFGLDKNSIRDELAPLFKRFDWADGEPDRSSQEPPHRVEDPA
jgi:hypothetical protein